MKQSRVGQRAYRTTAACALAWTLLALSGCTSDSGERIKVNTGVGSGVSFAEHGDTYDWLPPRSGDKHEPWNDVPEVHQLFRELVDSELNSRGYRRQAASSDALRLDDRLIRRTVGNPNDIANDRRINTVALYVLKPNSESVAWQTQAEVEFRARAQSSAELRQRLERVVKEMLAPVKPRTP
jgi:hypothetical protein